MNYLNELNKFLGELEETVTKLSSIVGAIVCLVSKETKSTEAPVVEEKKPSVSLEQLRSYLGEMSRNGMTDSVKQLLKRYGADKLSMLKPSDYDAVYLDAEEINNGR